MTHTSTRTQVLMAYLDDYLRRCERLSYRQLEGRQDGRCATLAFGAAGIAYALLHVAAVTGSERALRGAVRWAGEAWEHRHHPRAYFSGPDGPRRHLATAAFHFGQVGVCFVAVLAAAAGGDRDAFEDRLGSFQAACRQGTESPALFMGAAGTLHATALLLRATGAAALRPLGRELASRLDASVRPLDGRPVAWDSHPGPGLAHGATGALLARLAWCAAADEAVPAGLPGTIDALLADALADPARYCPRPTYTVSICNGFSGLATLALAAHAVLGGAGRRAAARRATRLALDALPRRVDLCCGRLAAAAACLGLAATPSAAAAWRRRAGDLVLSTLLADAASWHAAGLYGGEAALPCLAADLVAGDRGDDDAAAAAGAPVLAWPPDRRLTALAALGGLGGDGAPTAGLPRRRTGATTPPMEASTA